MNVSMATVAEDVGTSITGIQTADHAVHPGHGDADDHGQQAGVDDGSSPSLRGRLDHLRRRFSDNGVRSQSCGSADRMVVPRRRRCGTHHARDRRARRHQLSGAEAPGCLRSGRCRRRDGRGGRAADRRRRDDICVMALRVRRRSRDRCPDLAGAEQGGRRPTVEVAPRLRRIDLVRGRAGHDRLRRTALERVGLGAGQTRRTAAGRAFPGGVAADRRAPGRVRIPALGGTPGRCGEGAVA